MCVWLCLQVALQPGLEDVINDLLSFEAGEGAEFYIKPCPGLEGESANPMPYNDMPSHISATVYVVHARVDYQYREV